MRSFASVFVVCCLAGSIGVARADIVSYSVTLDQVSSIFGDTIETFESSVGNPSFTANFMTDKQLRVTFSAPTGLKFAINPPPVSGDTHFFIQFFSFGAGNLVDLQEPGVSVDFTGAEGSLPIESGGSRFVSVNPSGFSAFYSATLSDPFSFQSVSLLFDVPAGYNESFTSIVPSIAFSFSADPVFPNPGAWAGFQPVTPNQIPEPSTLSLLSIAIGLIALRKRRLQARRMGKPQS